MSTTGKEMGEELGDDRLRRNVFGVCHRNMIDAAVRISLPRL
jgi:hypothetical protein